MKKAKQYIWFIITIVIFVIVMIVGSIMLLCETIMRKCEKKKTPYTYKWDKHHLILDDENLI